MENCKKFIVPGRIAFREGPISPIAVLVSPYGSVEVSLYGGHLLSYRPLGHSPVLWLAKSHSSVQKGKAIRGGIPVCWPWFGAKTGLPAHGFARTLSWSIVSSEYDKDSTTLVLGCCETEETLALWPHHFNLTLSITIGEKLCLELTTENADTVPFEITEALHTYFRVKDVEKIAISGFDGEPYIDKAPFGKDSVQSGKIAISGEIDRVYNHHKTSALLVDGEIKRRILIEKEGSHATVVWNPWIEKSAGMKDMEDGDYKNFVCVEAANALGSPITIAPGKKQTMKMEITALLM